MRVSLLGPVVAHVGDAAVDLGGTKQRAVFAMLAMSAGQVVAMDRLIDDLWHEEPPARATVTLRAYVSRLRRSLDSARTLHGADVPEIRTQPPGWLLTLPAERVDLMVFREQVERARRLLSAANSRPTAQDLEAGNSLLVSALSLWQGDMLADLTSIEVAHTEAARAEDLRLAAQELLLETRLSQGEHQRVVDDARAFVARHPYRERAWAALVLALYRSGRQSDALTALAELRALLREELGIDPSPPLQELEQQVLRHDTALLPTASLPQPPTATRIEESVRRADTSLVVGRTDTVDLIEQLVDEAQAGRGRLLVLEAESGAGKSTMLDLLGNRVTESGGRVVRGGAGGAGAMPALWPWVTVVRSLEADGHLDQSTSRDSGTIATALALMGSARVAAAATTEVAFSRTALYRGVVELLDAARRNRPLVVIFDDLQWVDDETLNLLLLVVAELAPHGVLFAVAVRADDPNAPRVLDALVRTARTVLVRHQLSGLDDYAVSDLAHAVSGQALGPELVGALRAVTAGNPLFVTELVRLLSAERRLTLDAVTSTLPERAHDVLRLRIERLPGPSVGLLQVCAVARSPVEVDLLAAVVGHDPDQVLDDVEAAFISGLLIESSNGTGFAPSHDLVRQAVLIGMSSARRIRLHARLAAALQAHGPLGPAEVLEVSHHLVAAAPAVGPAAAIPYLLSASEDALSRYATITAARILEETLEAAQRIDDAALRAQTVQHVRGRLAMIHGYVGEEADLEGDRTDPPLPLDETSLPAWVGTVTMTAARGDLIWARDVARRALERTLPIAGEIVVQLTLGWTTFALGDIHGAGTAMEQVTTLCKSGPVDGPTGIYGSSLEVAQGYCAMIAHALGDDQLATTILDQARRRPGITGTGLVNLELEACLIDCARGDAIAALMRSRTLIAMAAELEYPAFDLLGRIMSAWATAMSGTTATPAPMVEALERYHGTGLLRFGSTFAALLAEVCLRAGDLDGATAAADRIRTLVEDTGEVVFGPRLSRLVARLE